MVLLASITKTNCQKQINEVSRDVSFSVSRQCLCDIPAKCQQLGDALAKKQNQICTYDSF